MFHGFINLKKPKGWTSHDCVARTRRLLNTKKVGHSGTLDPLATGVLPVAVGKATRLLQYLPEGKAYRATIRFGVKTTTDDLEGEVVHQVSAAHLERSHIEALFPNFVGTLTQTPPMYSAVQVNGKRLYDLARQGKAVEVPSRQVVIKQLHSQSWQSGEQPELVVDIVCGPGTYIRSLARDLGEAVNTGATLAGLVRTYSNGFEIKDSLTLEALAAAIKQKTFVPVAAGGLMEHLNAIDFPAELARRWCLGQKLSLNDVTPYLTPQITSHLEQLADTHSSISDHESTALAQPMPIRVMNAESQAFLGIGEFRAGLPTVAHEANSPLETVFAPKRVFAEL
ncbi:MAG: tRNA pseudouridine(55) synthase TruB [Cyanobacteria bacterium J06560_2]